MVTRRGSRIGTCEGLLLIALLAPSRAHAQAPTPANAQPFRLVWSSSAECGHGASFVQELEEKTTLLRPAVADEHAVTFIVETFRTESGVRGKLTVRKPDAALSVREVPGSSCEEVRSAMALIAALMFDPLAGDSARGHHRAPPPPAPAAPPPASRWTLRLEQRLTTRTAVAPALAWGQALGVAFTRESTLRPSVSVSVQTASATASAPHGSADLAWVAAQLSLCPAGLAPSPSWDLRACGVLQLGRLKGSGFRTEQRATKSISWLSPGLGLEARYQLLGPLWAGLEGTFTFPTTRESFYIQPTETLHRVPATSVSLGAGLGLRFF